MVRLMLAALGLAAAWPAGAQDVRAWLDAKGLEAAQVETFEDFEVAIARNKGATDAKSAQEQVVILRRGKLAWQSNPKETDPGSRWKLHAVGRDLNGDGQPELHLSNHTGGPHCCTTHHVLRLKPQVRRLAAYSAGNVGGGEFVEIPGRKQAVMVSADDSSAYAFAPYANSYFPLMILQVGPRGRLQFAKDLMQSRLPGQPPPVCGVPAATANPWLRERCGEYATIRRNERTAQIKQRLAEIKATRSDDKLDWEDYFKTGVLAAVSAEMNRYAYTGHGYAAMNWLEAVWPGNDAVKLKFIATLQQTQSKSAFAADLRALAATR